MTGELSVVCNTSQQELFQSETTSEAEVSPEQEYLYSSWRKWVHGLCVSKIKYFNMTSLSTSCIPPPGIGLVKDELALFR